jgi:hypothetical protein
MIDRFDELTNGLPQSVTRPQPTGENRGNRAELNGTHIQRPANSIIEK